MGICPDPLLSFPNKFFASASAGAFFFSLADSGPAYILSS